MNLLKTIVFFLFFTGIVSSQTKKTNDTILASQYFKKADSFLADRKLDSSIVYFEKALPIYEKAKAWERVAGCYNGVAESQWRDSKHEKSIFNARKALNMSTKYLLADSNEKANASDNIGKVYFRTSDYNSALTEYEKGLNIRLKQSPENNLGIAKSFNQIGHVYRKKGQYQKALDNFTNALNIRKIISGDKDIEIANDYNSIGSIYFLRSDYNEALKYFEKALYIGIEKFGIDHIDVSTFYNNMGIILERKGDYDRALGYYEKYLKINLNHYGNSHSKLALVYNNIGNVLDEKGEYDKSIEYYIKTINIKSSIYGENHPNTIRYYNNIGNALRKAEKYNEALKYFEKFLKIELYSLGKNHPNIANIYNNFGLTYSRKNEYDKALEYFQKAKTIYLFNFGENNLKTIDTKSFIGSTYFQEKRYDSALYYLKNALSMRSNILGENHPFISSNANEVAFVYYSKGEYRTALKFFNKALIANTNKFAQHKMSVLKYLDSKILLSTLKGLSNSYKSLYKEESYTPDLIQSIEIYKKADTIINLIRRSYANYNDKLTFAKTAKEVYLGAIESQILINKEKNDGRGVNQAFYYSEKSKSNTLKDLLTDSNAKSFSGLSKDLIELEKDLRIDNSFYESKINKEFSKQQSDSLKITNYENKLFDISRRQDSLTEVLEKNYPKYHQLKYKNKVVSVEEIQQQLDDKTTLVEFFMGDSSTYAFTISKNKIAVKELPTPALDEQIEQFRTSITKNYEEYKNISNQLYQTLIAPIKDELVGNQLIIVPDGSLWHLNFDLLLTEKDTSNNPKTWPYLLKEYAISYANSATLLFEDKVQENTVSKELQECLAFSFSSGDNISSTRNVSLEAFRNSSTDLPGTRKEIKAIANIVDGQYFYGSEATEQNFKKHAGAYNILHLAVHGSVDNERPENSKLYFTKSKDTLEDNYLYSHELFALDIPAELTVLSACNTGTGKIAKGEGIMSLGNAFQYAGTKSLLLTNWEVSDETTPKIMEYFYTYLKEGKNKAEALQQAKLQFLTTTNEETNHPYYWGGFYLLGDITPIQFHDTNIYWVIGFGVLVSILLSLFWYRKKNSSLRRG